MHSNSDLTLTLAIPPDQVDNRRDDRDDDENFGSSHDFGPPALRHSPTGVLRKSGGRRNNPVQQRVKFDDDVDGDVRLRNSDRPRNPSDRYSAEITRPQFLEDSRRSQTPENTLTRNYRHSLRDKCGEYYRATPLPPNAQSSPRDRPLSDTFPHTDDFLLEPLHIKSTESLPSEPRPQAPKKPKRFNSEQVRGNGDVVRGLPPRNPTSSQTQNQNREPLGPINAYADLPPLGPLSGDFPLSLRSSKKRGSHRKSNDSRHSYPPPLAPKPQLESRPSHPVDTKNNDEDDERLLADERYPNKRDPERERERKLQYIHKPSLSVDSAHGSSGSGSISQHDSSLLNVGPPGNNNIYRTETPSPRANMSALQMKPTPYANRNVNRELRIVVKPELSHRDSALPSSNETSSNDSEENMLCSQV